MMKCHRNALTLVATIFFLGGCVVFGRSAPTIDGVIGAREWEGSQSFAMRSGGRIRILKLGSRLYIAVSGPEPGFPTIFIAGKRSVEVLHASAAQGMVSYALSGGIWHANQTKFDFALREVGPGEQPPDEIRSSYLKEYGWISTSSKANAKDREFEVVLRPDQNAVAVAFLEIPSLRVAYWPTQIGADARRKDLLSGDVPDVLKFDTSRWHRITH
jgi:hypothetical protein